MTASATGGSAASQDVRLTPTQAFRELAMAVAQRSTAPESSVTVKRNAKGVFEFEVTVRGEDAELCSREAQHIVVFLEVRYPYPVTNGSTE
jgi:hypothetical protein